jgi:hypothetical protein
MLVQPLWTLAFTAESAEYWRKGIGRTMTCTQLPGLQRGFPPDINKPVHDGGNACRLMNRFVGIRGIQN